MAVYNKGLAGWLKPKECGGYLGNFEEKSKVQACASINARPWAFILAAITVVFVSMFLMELVGVAGVAGGILAGWGVWRGTKHLYTWFAVRNWENLISDFKREAKSTGKTVQQVIQAQMKRQSRQEVANTTAAATILGAETIASALEGR